MNEKQIKAVQAWRKGEATLATKETMPPKYEIILKSGERISLGEIHPWEMQDDLTQKQRDLLQTFEWGCSGIVEDGDGWLIYDTSIEARFDFDPRKLLGPIQAFVIPVC